MPRRIFVYTQGGQPLPEPIEVTDNWMNVVERQPVYTDRYMEGVAALDGTDIGSRKKRREYMKVHNLADFSDFKNVRVEAEKKREAMKRGELKDPARREAIGRAMYQHEKGKRR